MGFVERYLDAYFVYGIYSGVALGAYLAFANDRADQRLPARERMPLAVRWVVGSMYVALGGFFGPFALPLLLAKHASDVYERYERPPAK